MTSKNSPADLVKLDIPSIAKRSMRLSLIVHRQTALIYRGRELASKMRELIPRQMFDIAVQAAIGSHIIARENIKGVAQERFGEVLWRRYLPQSKLLEKQKSRRKRMKQVGNVEIPQEAFLAILQVVTNKMNWLLPVCLQLPSVRS